MNIGEKIKAKMAEKGLESIEPKKSLAQKWAEKRGHKEVLDSGESKDNIQSSQMSTTGEELSSFVDYGVPISTQLEDSRKQRAKNQSSLEQGTNAIVKGTGKGLLITLENAGYLGDLPDMFAGVDAFEDANGNWLSNFAKEQQQSLDEWAPIYRENPNQTWDMDDSGWWWQQIEGVVGSGVGFGLTGAAVGSLIGRGAAALSQMTKMGLIGEEIVATLGTAAATNYAESRMMALELFKDVHDRAIKAGKTEEEANKMAAKQGKDFMIQNKINI